MADSTLDSELFTLNCGKWGPVSKVGGKPTDGFDGASHHNVAAPAFPVGSVWAIYCDGSTGKEGFSEMTYLLVGTQNANSLIAVKSICVSDSATNPMAITNDPDDCIALPTGRLAVALSAITDAYYGWFWTGGICPEQYVSGLGGNYATDDNVAAGMITAHDLDADYIGLGPRATTEGIAGYSLAADA